MRSAIIENGVVTTIIVGSVEWSFRCADEVSIGWTYSVGEFTAPVEVIDLDEHKTILKAEIDAAAEAERLKYITAGAGQAMTYQRKANEAKNCLAAPDPQASDFPLLAAEIGITAATLNGVAQVVNAAHEYWLVVETAIEVGRLGTKSAIEAAMSANEAQAIADAWLSATRCQGTV